MERSRIEIRRMQSRERQRRHRANLTDEQRLASTQENTNARRNRRNPTNFIQIFRNNYNENNCEVSALGEMVECCSHCNAKFWDSEKLSTSTRSEKKFSMCCLGGKVELPLLPPAPTFLENLLNGTDNLSGVYFANIRALNSSLAFTSVGVNFDQNLANGQQGVYTFRINGAVHHKIGSLIPNSNDRPKFLQMYIYDTNNELENRHNNMPFLNRQLLSELQQMQHEMNPFVQQFKIASEMVANNNLNFTIRLPENHSIDRRYHNIPAPSQIAVLLPGDGNETYAPRDIILKTTQGPLTRISEIHPSYDPLHYVLLFPTGALGYHSQIEYRNPTARKVSLREFYAYRLMYRNEKEILHRSRRLFAQYIVDCYAKQEAMRLLFIRNNQSNLRAEVYQGVQDALNEGDGDAATIGKRMILPSSFTGGPRHMHRLFQDAMSIVRKFGKPSFFITFTGNPNWDEIKNELLPGQCPNDRPDLICRVFRQKLKEFLYDLHNRHVLGKVIAFVYVIEFQKRGMPHCHILEILDETNRIYDVDMYDQIVCCEIPNLETEPALYNIITKVNLHGPCGAENPSSPCMQEGKCSKGFPKNFQDSTALDKNGFPLYRRLNNGVTYKKRVNGFEYDNRWVVGYNKHMSRKFNAHINVEICSSVSAIKYLYKYVYKGSDRTLAEVRNIDEIQQFIDARYIAQEECAWRTLAFEMQDHFPAVFILALHLEHQQQVYFRNDATHNQLQNLNTASTLTMWFQKNSEDVDARQFTYLDFVHHYVWKNKKWENRLRGSNNIIARIRSASPREGDVFYLRILLHHVKGATSFSELRKYGNIVCASYKGACIERGLLADDLEWTKCLEEASNFKMPIQMRQLFAMVLIHCEPSQPQLLWEKFKLSLCEDFLHERQVIHPNVELNNSDITSALLEIENFLNQNGSSLSKFPEMPKLDVSMINTSRIIQDEMNFISLNEREKYETNFRLFNDEQKHAFEIIMSSLGTNYAGTKLFFIDGPGGTGKSFLFNTFLSKIRSEGKIALAVASSGIAAQLLDNGRTAHSRFKIPLCIHETSTCNISYRSDIAELIRKAEIIIWDEISMANKYIFEAVDRTFKDLLKCNEFFGGKVIVLGGDFRQILPVVLHGGRSDIVNASIKKSYIWEGVKKIKLSTNMRALNSRNDREFSEYLLRIGEGKEIANGCKDKIQIPQELTLPLNNMESLVNFIYFENSNQLNKSAFLENAILAPTNNYVDSVNTYMLNKLIGDEKIYCSADEVIAEDNAVIYPTEFLNSLEVSGLPPHKLVLKVGCPIILLRNLNPSIGLSNGTKLLIINLKPNIIEAEICVGSKKGNRVLIPRIPMIPSATGTTPCTFKRRQFPVRVAFAMTINKAQGQTLNKVGLLLDTPVFSHGQLYVGMSRTGIRNNLKIVTEENRIVRNIVFNEIFFD